MAKTNFVVADTLREPKHRHTMNSQFECIAEFARALINRARITRCAALAGNAFSGFQTEEETL
jgi:hypothetical protein